MGSRVAFSYIFFKFHSSVTAAYIDMADISRYMYLLDSECHTNMTVGILISSIQGCTLDIDVMLMQCHSPDCVHTH